MSSSMEPQIKNPSRRKKNHGSRSSEISNPMRRSFTGNPFGKPSSVAVPRGFDPVTPANSPSAFPRSSIDMSSKPIDRELEEKENGLDRFAKQSWVESPGLTKHKKHFMSPTISAVSKINASPRKKIFAEKNELARSSWSSLNVSEEGSASRSEVEASESCEKTVTDFSSTRSRNSSAKKVAFDSELQVIPPTDPGMLSVQEEAERSDCFDSHEVDAENMVEKSPHIKSPCSPLVPLNADPQMAPYDPETNYLSPRPQFLHYRPTPRIKRFLSEETDGHYLNDSIDFVEGLSDAELTEETSSDDSSRGPQSDVLGGIGKEMKDDEKVIFLMDNGKIEVDGSTEMEKEPAVARDVIPAEKTERTLVSGNDLDDLDITITDATEATEEVLVVENEKENETEVKQAAKGSGLFTKSKFCALILAVIVAGMVTSSVHSPITSCGVSISNDGRFCKIIQEAGIGKYGKTNVDGVARNFVRLRDDLVGYIFGLMSKMRAESEFGQMNYYNLSFVQEDSVFKKDTDNCLLLDIRDPEENVVESWLEHGAKAAPLEEEDENSSEEDNDSLKDAEREAEETQMDCDSTGNGSFEDAGSNEMLLWDEDTKQEEFDLDAIESEFQEKFEIELRNELIQESHGIQSSSEERSEIVLGDEWTDNNEPGAAQSRIESVQPAVEFQVKSSLEVGKDDLEPSYSRNEPSAVIAISAGGISALVLTLVTFACLVYFKTKGAIVMALTSKEQQPWKLNKFDISPASVIDMEDHHSHLWQKKRASSSCPTVVDIAGESCPSEMSSYQKNSFKSEGQERASCEVHSCDRKHRKNNINKRESLASSSDFSMGSPSYGSFTTYEKIPLKHRNGEEEVVITPIRRSSRLLKQVVSP